MPRQTAGALPRLASSLSLLSPFLRLNVCPSNRGNLNVLQYEYYQKHSSAYLLVSEVQQVLGSEAAHLSDSQADALARILIGNPSSMDRFTSNAIIPYLNPVWIRGDAYSSGMAPGGQPQMSDAGYGLLIRPSDFVYIDVYGSIDS